MRANPTPKIMALPYRWLCLALVACFGATLAGRLVRAPSVRAEAPPVLLPTAYAAPAEVGFSDTLRSGETLSELLGRSRLAASEARVLLAELEAHQDPRGLHPGATVSYRKSLSDGSVRGMEFQLDADRRLALRRELVGWRGDVEEVPVRTDTTVLAGEVKSSLYGALLDGRGLSVPGAEREGIADVVADVIFPWQIDFSRDLRPGDSYRIVYERQVRPDGSARGTRVLAAWFSIDGREHDAFLFHTGGKDEYFDGDGESLRRAFLRAPLAFRRVSSLFSSGRYHPILHRLRAHRGIDYAARAGTPVRAVGAGTVVRAGRAGGYGNLLEIRHGRGYATRYGHLRGFAEGIRPGVRVEQGDVIGYVGMSGLATGPHLHYEFHADGRAVDPNSERVRRLTGDPVLASSRDDFAAVVAASRARMEGAARIRLAAAGLLESGGGE